MEALLSNAILEYNPNQMAEVRKIFGYDDLNRLRQDIDILKDWIKMQQHFIVKEYEEAYLERHLICSKGSIERAKKHIDKLCTLRGLMPDYLLNFDIENEFDVFLAMSNAFLLPKPTPDNYRVIFGEYYNPDAPLYDMKSLGRYLILMVEYLHRFDYNAGIEIVYDPNKITFGILSKMNPIVLANTLMIITEAVGLRVKGIHVISGSKFFDAVLAIIKRGLPKKLTSRLHVHENYEAMFKFIPKYIFPKNLGGDYPATAREINENNFKALSSPEFIRMMKFFETAVTDESKRLSSKFNEDYSGMPGSFKVLNVD